MTGASVPDRAGPGHACPVRLLSDRGGAGDSVDGSPQGWGLITPEELEFWYQRRKEGVKFGDVDVGLASSLRGRSWIKATGKAKTLFSFSSISP